jgi:hypothetical protein
MKNYNFSLKLISMVILAISFSSCSAVINEVLNDNKFDDGDYLFVMYKSNESSISVYGLMSIYYMSSDSTVTGSYSAEMNKNFILNNDKGGIIGKANWNSGEAKLRLGNSFSGDVELTLRKNIDIVEGEWSSGYSRGKIYAFRKNKW